MSKVFVEVMRRETRSFIIHISDAIGWRPLEPCAGPARKLYTVSGSDRRLEHVDVDTLYGGAHLEDTEPMAGAQRPNV